MEKKKHFIWSYDYRIGWNADIIVHKNDNFAYVVFSVTVSLLQTVYSS